MKQPLVLCIMDGVGINPDAEHNAVARANMPFFDNLLKKYPHSKLDASGTSVGLPMGTMGNSEVGHITIGAGRVVNQFLRRFQIENWDTNPGLNQFIASVKNDGGIVHVAGDDTIIIVARDNADAISLGQQMQEMIRTRTQSQEGK